MAAAIARGQYSGTDLKRLLLMAGAVGYVASPVDLMPELVLGIAGLADDALVIGWLAVAVINATDDFLDWERRRDAIPGEVIH